MPGIAGETANLIVALKLDDSGFSGKLNRAASQLRNMDAGLSQMGRGVGQVSGGLLRLGERAAVAAGVGLAGVVTTAVRFEDAFAGVEKTVDGTEAQLAALEDMFRQMARTIPVSFEELSAIGESAGALGIAIDSIDEFTKVAATLGVTTDVSSEQAATALGVLSNVLKLTTDDYERFADVLVQLGNDGSSTESAILGVAERAGAGAALLGIAADETLAWSAAVANLGIEVEAGGSAIQKFFVETLKNVQDDDTLQVMAETAGMTADAFEKAFAKDASGALRTFIGGLGDLREAERLAVLEALGFSDIRITRTLLGLSGNVEQVERAFANLAKAEGAATTEAEKRYATTASQLKIFKQNVQDAAATIGFELLPVTNELIQDFTGWLNQADTQQGLREFALDLAEGVRSLANELRGTDFSGIIGGIKIAAEVAKTAFDAFRSLPAPIQQLAVAAFAVNKLSGGAIGQIAAGMGNLLLGSLKTITAGHVTVVGGTVTGGPGGIGGGGGGGLLGKIGGGLAIAGGVAAAGVAVDQAIKFDVSRDQMVVDLQNMLDKLPRATGAEIDRSISRIESVISQERPLLEGILFNTNIKPSLDSELAELRQLKMAQVRAEAAARDAIPWVQRNAEAAARAAQIQASVLAATQGTKHEVSRLANVPHNVNVNNSITVPVSVSATMIQNAAYRSRVAHAISRKSDF